MTEKKKQDLLDEIAKELAKKHNLELWKDCLAIGELIYNLAKNNNE